MAYDRQEIFEKAVALAGDSTKNLLFIQDVIDLLPISKDTFYRFFPKGSDEYDAIKEKLEENKVNTKIELRRKMQKSSNPANLLALYKLICSDEERKNLSMKHIEHGGELNVKATPIKFFDPDAQYEQDDDDEE